MILGRLPETLTHSLWRRKINETVHAGTRSQQNRGQHPPESYTIMHPLFGSLQTSKPNNTSLVHAFPTINNKFLFMLRLCPSLAQPARGDLTAYTECGGNPPTDARQPIISRGSRNGQTCGQASVIATPTTRQNTSLRPTRSNRDTRKREAPSRPGPRHRDRDRPRSSGAVDRERQLFKTGRRTSRDEVRVIHLDGRQRICVAYRPTHRRPRIFALESSAESKSEV